jgi:hypothetical protein
MEKELKEELILIAERVPPSDRWALLSDPNYVYKSLTEVLEGYFEEAGGLSCDFRLSPMKGKLYAIDSVVVEKAAPPPPPPPKKFNMYGDY